jgi:hypothetical protein
MICRNCGLQNPSGFAFCGSCGQALETAAQGDVSSLDDTLVTPTVTPRPAKRSLSQAVPIVPTQTEAAAGHRQSVVCRNCGRANAASRSVCYQCGRRLVMPAATRYQRAKERDATGAGAFAGSGASVLALLAALGAGGLLLAVVFLGAGAQPAASPLAVLSPEPVVSPTPTITAAPSVSPTRQPTAQPTMPPSPQPVATPDPATEPPATAPSATGTTEPSASPTAVAPTLPPIAGADCSGSSVETAWLNLTRDDARERVPAESTWCVHQVFVVPYFGSGRIRLVVDGETIAEVIHEASSSQSEYSIPFTTPFAAEEGARLAYQYRCNTADCTAVIQIGYDPLTPP